MHLLAIFARGGKGMTCGSPQVRDNVDDIFTLYGVSPFWNFFHGFTIYGAIETLETVPKTTLPQLPLFHRVHIQSR